jgi:hypothetical protein
VCCACCNDGPARELALVGFEYLDGYLVMEWSLLLLSRYCGSGEVEVGTNSSQFVPQALGKTL